MKQEQGFSLIEILIALFVLGLGLVGILTLYPVGVASTRDILAHSRAALLASTARATLITLDAGKSIRDWQLLNSTHPRAAGPWFYPSDDEVFVPYEPTLGNPSSPYSFIPGDADAALGGALVIESPDAPLFSFNVVVRKSVLILPVEKPLHIYMVGNPSNDAGGSLVTDISPLPLPLLDYTHTLTNTDANGEEIDGWDGVNTLIDTFHTTTPISPTGLQNIHVTGNLHVSATFTNNKTDVDVDSGWAWPKELKVGNYLQGPDGNWYRVQRMHPTDPTATLLISRKYAGLTIIGTALVGRASGSSPVAQTAVFRSRNIIDKDPNLPNDPFKGELKKDPAECLLEVDQATADILEQLKIRPGDHLALKPRKANPADPDFLDFQHGFWYEIAEIRPNAIDPLKIDVVLKQPEARITEPQTINPPNDNYAFVVTRTIIGLYETSLGPK